MRIAYFDAFAGISGNMVLGAFISAGINVNQVKEELRKLNQGEIEIHLSTVVQSNISAIRADVAVNGNMEHVTDSTDLPGLIAGVDYSTRLDKDEAYLHSEGRSYLEIKNLIQNSQLSENVKKRSLTVFKHLARAEMRIHNSSEEEIHFHEVGSVYSIAEIVGVSACIELSGVEAIYTSPIMVGSGGFVKAQHGVLPIPTPATIEILKGYPIILDDMPYEMTTPTGAAIVRAFSRGVIRPMYVEVESIGYGAGTKEFKKIPGLLRIMIGNICVHDGQPDLVTKVNVEQDNY
ncbi:MAG: LarC family nickel insertion protein [Candidatus Kryptoniota bacterium]